MSGLWATLLLAACGGAPGGGENAAVANDAAFAAPVANPTTQPGTAPSPVASAAAAEAETLDAFWSRFRRAALANDAAAIRALSAPTVEQLGELDDSPVVKLAPAQVPAVLARILERPDGVDDAGRTQRALLEAAASPPPERNQPADNYRFGDMEFERDASGWRLVRVYYEAE